MQGASHFLRATPIVVGVYVLPYRVALTMLLPRMDLTSGSLPASPVETPAATP